MRNRFALSLVAVFVSLLMAATPIATVVSGEGLTVRGTPVPATSVSSWPVASGDELASGASPAVVMFKDQTRVTLGPNSRVKLDERDGNSCVVLLQGSIGLSAASGAKLGVGARGTSLVAQTPFEGQVSLGDANTVNVAPKTGTLPKGKSPCTGTPIFAAMGGAAGGGAIAAMGGKTAAVVIVAAAAGGTAAAIALTRGADSAASPSVLP